jgi:hypothetical protein
MSLTGTTPFSGGAPDAVALALLAVLARRSGVVPPFKPNE